MQVATEKRNVMTNGSARMSQALKLAGLLLAACACVAAVPARAETVLLEVNGDFNDGSYAGGPPPPSPTYSGTAAAPNLGTYWNGIDGGGDSANNNTPFTTTSSTLLAANGVTTTPITVSWYAPFGTRYVAFNPPTTTDSTAPILMEDMIAALGGRGDDYGATGTFSFNNLPDATYDLYLYSQEGAYNDGVMTFAIDGGPSATANNLTGLDQTPGDTNGFVQGGDYVLFSSLSPVGGVISGTFFDANNSGSGFNGFQLVELPEPASMSLIAVGGLILLKRRRV